MSQLNHLPGVQTGRTVTPRQILRNNDYKVQIGGVLDGTNSIDGANTGYTYIIRAGALLGYNSTSKKWAPLKRSKVNGTSGAVTAVVLDDARFFVAGDVVSIGSDTGITITAVNYSTNTITIASTTVADNEDVVVTNGFQTARGILLDDEVKLRNIENTAAADKPCNILIAGFVFDDMILGDLTNALADTGNKLSHIIFDGDHGL